MLQIDFQKIFPLLQKNSVLSAGVFGSYVKGERTPNDIDILIELKKPLGLIALARLEDEISQALNMPVDLVTKPSLSPFIREQILNDTQIFYEQR